MAKKDIKNIEKDAKPLDLILLELPASAMSHGGAIDGTDYAVGFYLHVKDDKIYLNQIQKAAYSNPKPIEIPFDDVESYKILRRYKPDSKDGLDKFICEMLDITINKN